MKSKTILFLFLVISLSGCSAFGKTTPQALPTIVLDQGKGAPSTTSQTTGSGVTASGAVVPGQQAQLAFGVGGRVQSLDVSVGVSVKAGQLLAQLEGREKLEADISTAQFELEQAQQAHRDLTTQAEEERVQAMQDIVAYERTLRDAQYALDNFTIPMNQTQLDAVEALNQMKLNLDKARQAFEPYKNKSSGDQTRKDKKEDLDEAQADYNTAVRRLKLEYDLEVAQAQLDKALRNYAILKAGPDPDKVKLAEARQQTAEDRLAASQAALESLTLTAPFDGTIANLDFNIGEWVIAGQPILALADLEHLRVETTDLSERDVPEVKIGQPVTVFIKALDTSVDGHVTEIAPLADTLGGDVVYQVSIELDTIPEGLRAGMSVDVNFETG